ncbi:RDD family protein [Luteimonas gilva]|nr:RDD family protein [Luteimonas gilva]
MAEVPAGFWKRYAAWSLDAAILALPVWLLSAERIRTQARALLDSTVALSDQVAQRMVDMLMEGGDPVALAHRLTADSDVREAIRGVAAGTYALAATPVAWFAVFAAIYWIAFEGSAWQATPGKRALGLRAAGLDGESMSWPRTALRHAAGALSWLTLNLGHALAAWTPQKRALHDLIAGTRVLAKDGSMPGWAKLWLGLQIVAAIAACAWLYLTLLSAMQASVDNALLQ